MNATFTTRHLMALLACVFAACLPAQLHAQGITNITATVTPEEAQIGEALEYNITITGNGLRLNPPNPKAPADVELQYRGHRTSSQHIFRNGVGSHQTSLTFGYIVRGMKAGDYTIPAQEFTYERRRYSIPAVSFRVTDSPLTSPNAGNTAGAKPKVWSTLKLARPHAYVGEMVPAELRVYFDRSVRVLQQPDRLDVKIEGFTVQEWQATQPREEIVDGKPVLRFTFHTAIAPAKPGKFTLPPISSTWLVRTQDQRRGRIDPNDPFGALYSMDPDAFDSFFGGGGQRQVPISSEPLEVEVRPLPDQGKPESFAGAVGKFGFLASVTPTEAKVGEPLTLKMKVTGQGNFGRVNAPQVKGDASTWKLYTPKSEFVQMDALGIEGAKNFEQLIIPQRATTKPPVIEFSYFDPFEETYVTLKPDELRLAVVGSPIAQKQPSAQPADPADADEAPKTEEGMAPLVTAFPREDVQVLPLFQRPAFWLAQGVPLALLLGLLFVSVRQHQREHPSAKKQLTGLRRELIQAQEALAAPGANAMDIYLSARRVLQLELELRSGKHFPDSQLQSVLRHHPKITGTYADDVDSFFERFDEIVYSGQGNAQLAPEEQQQVREFTHRTANHLG